MHTDPTRTSKYHIEIAATTIRYIIDPRVPHFDSQTTLAYSISIDCTSPALLTLPTHIFAPLLTDTEVAASAHFIGSFLLVTLSKFRSQLCTRCAQVLLYCCRRHKGATPQVLSQEIRHILALRNGFRW